MTTFKNSSRRRWVIRSIVSAVVLLAIAAAVTLMAVAGHFAGYEPDNVISLSGLHPLAVTSDGATLIAGTGPIRFLDLATGKDSQPPLALKAIKEMADFLDLELAMAKENKTGLTLELIKEMADRSPIADARLSDDDQRLVIVRDAGLFRVLTVFDLSKRAVILEKTIRFDPDPYDTPQIQLSHDGRLLAWANRDNRTGSSLTVWDLNANKERFCLPRRDRFGTFQLSPDGKLLALFSPSGFQLSDTATGAMVHSLERIWAQHSTPTFSPDSKFVAVDDYSGGIIRVFDTASGKLCFHSAKSCAPQFLSDGSLFGVRDSGRPAKGDIGSFIPEIVVWSSGDWSEKRAFVHYIGESLLSGTIIPQPLPMGRANQFALLYETGIGGWWSASPKVSAIADTGLGRVLALNVPRGLGLDVVDYATGVTKTYHLDGRPLSSQSSFSRFVVPQAGKILIPQSDDAVAVWSIPPRRSYRAVAAMAGILAAIGVVAYA